VIEQALSLAISTRLRPSYAISKAKSVCAAAVQARKD